MHKLGQKLKDEFGGENLRERGNMDDTGVEGKIILKRILKK
jgi:hypothetical protein